MVKFKRWLRHSFLPPWRWRLFFSQDVLATIETAVQQSESHHRGEIRFAIENTLPPHRVWRGISTWQRATEVFANLYVWDTEENCGILIYVLVADREVHIVADRGIHKRVPQTAWDNISANMRQYFMRGDFKQGAIIGIEQLTSLLIEHFPATTSKLNNELPDTPVILKN